MGSRYYSKSTREMGWNLINAPIYKNPIVSLINDGTNRLNV